VKPATLDPETAVERPDTAPPLPVLRERAAVRVHCSARGAGISPANQSKATNAGETSLLRAISPTTMRAGVITAPQKVEVVSVAIPEPGPKQVRVRLEGCGVCASNVPPWEGRPWFSYPMPPGQLGHESWGEVDAVGSEVTSFKIGDRVGVLSQRAFAEFDVADELQVVPLPPALGGMPFPAEPLGCALNIFRRSEVKAGQTVAIFGIGFLGAMLVQLAKSASARVIAVTRRPFSQQLAAKAGADEVIPLDDQTDVVGRIAGLTHGSGGYDVHGFCDVVIECTGKQRPLDLAAEVCAVRGRLVVAGYHQDGPRTINMQLWNWRGLDVINAHERDPRQYTDGMRAAAQAVAEGKLDVRPLLTHRFTLDRLGDALEMTRTRPEGFVKALVMMR
jgi:threonine dehydrogenase-like Zn-dependent dehydrogenase